MLIQKGNQQVTSNSCRRKQHCGYKKNQPTNNYTPNYIRYGNNPSASKSELIRYTLIEIRQITLHGQTVEPIEVINTGIASTNPVGVEPISTREGNKLPFIEANTKEVTMQYLKEECITPVFSKDNEVTISHSSFIETVWEAANKVFSNERIEEPAIRVSHVIKGRIPEAIHKPVNQLLESDKTIYFERMMFCFEIPTIYEDIAGNRLNLTIGGVRAYNHENLYSKKGTEKFKVFVA